MQLAMLAPYNNLATSVAAALVPTLLGPARINFGQAEQQIKKNQDTKPSKTYTNVLIAYHIYIHKK